MIDVRESTDKLKILIVDDSELNRELLAGMLGDEYEIYQVENGKKAIDILEENREQFKLVLLDINMPPPLKNYIFQCSFLYFNYLSIITVSFYNSRTILIFF